MKISFWKGCSRNEESPEATTEMADSGLSKPLARHRQCLRHLPASILPRKWAGFSGCVEEAAFRADFDQTCQIPLLDSSSPKGDNKHDGQHRTGQHNRGGHSSAFSVSCSERTAIVAVWHEKAGDHHSLRCKSSANGPGHGFRGLNGTIHLNLR